MSQPVKSLRLRRTQKLLREALIELIEECGFDTLTMREITGRAMVSQRSLPAVIVRARLERDPSNGAVTLYFNGEQIGPTIQFVSQDAAVLPTLYVRAPGVIVSITSWSSPCAKCNLCFGFRVIKNEARLALVGKAIPSSPCLFLTG